jgi:hypothetical protein
MMNRIPLPQIDNNKCSILSLSKNDTDQTISSMSSQVASRKRSGSLSLQTSDIQYSEDTDSREASPSAPLPLTVESNATNDANFLQSDLQFDTNQHFTLSSANFPLLHVNDDAVPMTTASSIVTESVASYATSYATTLDGTEKAQSEGGRSVKRQKKNRPRTRQKPGFTAKGEARKFVKHNYQDRCLEVPETIEDTDEALFERYTVFSKVGDKPLNKSGKKVRTAPFPLKLHMMLAYISKEGHEDIASWLSHGRAFQIFNPTLFQEKIMSKFFTMTRVTSFHRQLNLYGFTRLTHGEDEGAYYNEHFLRGKAFLTMKINRIKVKGTKIRAASSPDEEPNFYTMPPVNSLSKREKRSKKSNPIIRRKGGGYKDCAETESDQNQWNSNKAKVSPNCTPIVRPPANAEEQDTTTEGQYAPLPYAFDCINATTADTVTSSSVKTDTQFGMYNEKRSLIRRKGGGYKDVPSSTDQVSRNVAFHHSVSSTSVPQVGEEFSLKRNGTSFTSTYANLPSQQVTANYHNNHQSNHQTFTSSIERLNQSTGPIPSMPMDFWKARYNTGTNSVTETATDAGTDHILDTMTEDICSTTGGDDDYRRELVDKFQNWENDSLEGESGEGMDITPSNYKEEKNEDADLYQQLFTTNIPLWDTST